jgi:uncharacterized protein (TIGR02444 family)
MANHAKMHGSDFWSFSLSVYRDETVSAACIALQDRFGLDVNVLLFALFAGSRGRTLSRQDFEGLERSIAAWRENVVRPLRAVRRWLKHQIHLPHRAVVGLRRGVLAREIESEAHQQRLMESTLPIGSGSPDVDVAAENLLRYLELSGLTMDHDATSKLAPLLSATFAPLDEADATALLVARASTMPR